MTNSEYFYVTRIANLFDAPCFVTGEALESAAAIKSCLKGSVVSEEAGRRVVAMFDQGAVLGIYTNRRAYGGRPAERNYSVKIGVSTDYEPVLKILYHKILAAGHQISRTMVQESIQEYCTAAQLPYTTRIIHNPTPARYRQSYSLLS
jgi:hypothetical protein